MMMRYGPKVFILYLNLLCWSSSLVFRKMKYSTSTGATSPIFFYHRGIHKIHCFMDCLFMKYRYSVNCGRSSRLPIGYGTSNTGLFVFPWKPIEWQVFGENRHLLWPIKCVIVGRKLELYFKNITHVAVYTGVVINRQCLQSSTLLLLCEGKQQAICGFPHKRQWCGTRFRNTASSCTKITL